MSSEATYGGQACIELRHPTTGATATILQQGAHVVSWAPDGSSNVLYLSSSAVYEAGRAVRGGIPVCFPQFAGQGPLQSHGFARTAMWRVAPSDAVAEHHAVGSTDVAAVFVLDGECDSVPAGTPAFSVTYAVVLTEDNDLRLAFDVVNARPEADYDAAVGDPLGSALLFTNALHTYFAVPDVRTAEVTGLGGCSFIDKTDGMALSTWPIDGPGVLFAGQVDLAFRRVPRKLSVFVDGDPLFSVSTDAGFRDAVVWNPGEAKAAAMADVGDGEGNSFVCLESANVETVLVHAGDSHRATATIVHHPSRLWTD